MRQVRFPHRLLQKLYTDCKIELLCADFMWKTKLKECCVNFSVVVI